MIDLLQLVGQDVASNRFQLLLIVGHAQYAGIEGECMWKQKSSDELCHSLCGICRYDWIDRHGARLFCDMPYDAKAGEKAIEFADMRCQLFIDHLERSEPMVARLDLPKNCLRIG